MNPEHFVCGLWFAIGMTALTVSTRPPKAKGDALVFCAGLLLVGAAAGVWK
jgi:hypothetical protein